MANLATTKMTSRGQVVIPEDIRKRLNLKVGAKKYQNDLSGFGALYEVQTCRK